MPITYEQATQVTHDPMILTWIIVIWILPLILYLIIGATTRARSPSGQQLSKPMISYPNYWHAVWIWTLVQGLLFLGLFFPFWTKFLN